MRGKTLIWGIAIAFFIVQLAKGGDISFSERVIDYNLPSAFTVDVGDMDGDGDLDVLAGGQSGDLRIYVNNGSGNFTIKSIETNYGAIWSVEAYDVNKDGLLDIIAAISSAENITWYKNNGGLNFNKRIIDNNMVSAEDIAAGDLDGDGDVDLVGFGWNETTPTRWYENRNGDFIMHELDYSFQLTHFVAIADFDNDGDNDIVGANGNGISWWSNNGSGSFRQHVITTKFSGAYCAQPADLNQDGKMDIIGAAHNLNTVAWFKNSGSGNFTKRVLTDDFTETHDAYVGDLDRDGDMDFVATSRALNGVAWFENDGSYHFTEHLISTNVKEAQTVVLGDLDGDGDLDVVSEARRGNKVFWWKNESALVEVITAPNAPSGPSSGIANEDLLYTSNGASSNLGHSLEYQFDWGDGSTSSWGSNSASHAFSGAGTYLVRARARCAVHTSKVSGWSDAYSVTIEEETVSAPSTPQGPSSGVVGNSLDYSTSGAVSNLGHDVEYQFDWGNGVLSSWGSSSRSYQYDAPGNYEIKARARCKIHTFVVSDWSDAKSVTINVPNYEISGAAKYFSNDFGIEDVSINVTGDISNQYLTNEFGAYSFSVPENSSLKINAYKQAEQDIGNLTITMYDAALTAQSALNLIALTEDQQIAGDADCNGSVLTFDAALIAQYAVGLTSLPSSHVGEWRFVPDTIALNNVQNDYDNQDFKGIIIGDVDGSWTPPGKLKKSALPRYNYSIELERNKQKDELTLTLYVNDDIDLLSADFDITFSTALTFRDFSKSSALSNFKIFINPQNGRLRLGMFSAEKVEMSGQLFTVKFKMNESLAQKMHLQKLQLNEFLLAENKELVNSELMGQPSNYALSQNFPNPFNSTTQINYSLAKGGDVNLTIFDVTGKRVIELVNEHQSAGNYSLLWNGKDEDGKNVAGGIYFYELIIDGVYKRTRKMLLLK